MPEDYRDHSTSADTEGLGQMSAGRRIPWKPILYGVGGLFALGVVAVLGLFIWIMQGLPSADQLANYEPKITSRVYAGDGKLVGEFAAEHRVFVPSEEIPQQLIYAFISAEDKSFFEHSGIDWMGVLRGTLGNAVQGKRMAGGSTITQQVVKNMLVGDEHSAVRKAKEAILATRLEEKFTKDQILELYMNEIYLGHSSYGVAAAALEYFDTPLNKLSLAQCATLAALPQLPGRVNPIDGPDATVLRRNYVLDRMLANKYITAAEHDAAKAEKLVVPKQSNAEVETASQYFTEEVRQEIIKLGQNGQLRGFSTAKDASKGIWEGGLSIRSTIDTNMQITAQTALRAGLETYDHYYRGYAGPLTSFPNTADFAKQITAWARSPAGVAAISGRGPDWRLGVVLSTDKGVRIGLSDGKDGMLADEDVKFAKTYKRKDSKATGLQVGDVFLVSHAPAPDNLTTTILDYAGQARKTYPEKSPWRIRQIPVIEGAIIALDPHTGRVLAMDGGYAFDRSPFNRVIQAKRQPGSSFKPFVYAAAMENGFTPSSRVLDGPYVDCSDTTQEKCYMPGNYENDYYGLATLRFGVQHSRNTMTVRLATDMGLAKVAEMGNRLGIYDDLKPYTANALGSTETSPLRLATAYAELVNGGKKVEPVILDRIQNRYGETVYRHDGRPCPNCSTQWQEGMAPPALTEERKQLLDPLTAYQMVSILEGVVQYGTAGELKKVGKPLGAKTGTSNDQKDAWLMSFSPDLVVGVWIGFDNAKPMGQGATGGRMAAPIARDFLLATLKDAPALSFRRPQGISIVNINADSGCLPFGDSRDRLIIEEAYKPGTEPTTTCTVGAIEGASYKVDFGHVAAGDERGRSVAAPVDPNAPPATPDPNLPPGQPQPTPAPSSLTLKDGETF
jgi:penicillin-binding protein 1A